MLADIAQKMRGYAQQNPFITSTDIKKYQHTLSGGLTITYLFAPPMWKLSLARKGTIPSRKEEETVKRFFNVPDNAKKHSRALAGDWFVVRFFWIEPAGLFEYGPAEQVDSSQ